MITIKPQLTLQVVTMAKSKFDDETAWVTYPAHRKYFNKLWLSERLGYTCGPAGVAPPKPDVYIVRPIYNLVGMGLGAKEIRLAPGDEDCLEPGYFWCEKFEGVHRSIDYNIIPNNRLEQKSCFVGEKTDNQFVFKRWYRDNTFKFDPPDLLHDIFNHDESYTINQCNIEIIDNKVIEVHLRGSPDPDYDEFIPVFEGIPPAIPEHRIKKYKFIEDNESGGGWLKPKRLGFYVRNY